jgi:hypothetical protein
MKSINPTKKEYILARKNILLRYSRYKNSGAPMLKIAIKTDLVPNPKKYLNNAHETNQSYDSFEGGNTQT